MSYAYYNAFPRPYGFGQKPPQNIFSHDVYETEQGWKYVIDVEGGVSRFNDEYFATEAEADAAGAAEVESAWTHHVCANYY